MTAGDFQRANKKFNSRFNGKGQIVLIRGNDIILLMWQDTLYDLMTGLQEAREKAEETPLDYLRTESPRIKETTRASWSPYFETPQAPYTPPAQIEKPNITRETISKIFEPIKKLITTSNAYKEEKPQPVYLQAPKSKMGYLPQVIHPLIKKYFPREEWTSAQRVMIGESGGRPEAVGDTYPIGGILAPSYGLFQIRALPGRPDPEKLRNAEFNVAYAANLWKAQGWKPWYNTAKKLGLL